MTVKKITIPAWKKTFTLGKLKIEFKGGPGRKKIKEIPPEIMALERLQTLRITDNQITELPEFIEELENLKVLDLTGNPIKTIPAEIGNLQKLQELRLGKSELEVIPPEIAQLKDLEQLELRTFNTKARFPKEILQLPKLKTLILSGFIGEEWSKVKFDQLKQLQTLGLQSNWLDRHPTLIKSLEQLATVRQLNLRGNRLASFALQFPDLLRLDLSENPLQKLPKTIVQMPDLMKLSLKNTQLKTLPPEIQKLQELVELDLSENQLRDLPAELGKIKDLFWLDLSNNQLEGLPPEIGQLDNVAELDLSENQLEELPSEIGKMKGLTILDISRNDFQQLPDSINDLPQLQTLCMNNNPISTLDNFSRATFDSMINCQVQDTQRWMFLRIFHAQRDAIRACIDAKIKAKNEKRALQKQPLVAASEKACDLAFVLNNFDQLLTEYITERGNISPVKRQVLIGGTEGSVKRFCKALRVQLDQKGIKGSEKRRLTPKICRRK